MEAREALSRIIINRSNNRDWFDALYSVVILNRDAYRLEFKVGIPTEMGEVGAVSQVLFRVTASNKLDFRVIHTEKGDRIMFGDNGQDMVYLDARASKKNGFVDVSVISTNREKLLDLPRLLTS